jgi:hypothetical protein
MIMVDKKSIISNMPAMLAATAGLITAIIGLLSFMSAPAPSIVAFDASPNIISIGESSILKWSVTGNGATVNIEPDIGTVGLSGTREVAPNITTNYTLTTKNKDHEKIAWVKLIVREKNEGNQVTNDVVGGTAAKSDVPMQLDVKAEPDQKQIVIYVTPPAAAEPGNSDSKQNAVARPAQMAARTSNPSESTATDQSGMGRNAIVAPVSAIVPNTAAKQDSVSELTSPKATAPESNASEPIAHVKSGLNESITIDETPTIATYSNESNPSADSRLDTGSVDGGLTEPKAVTVVTAADWGRLKNVSKSENDFASNAPINSKLRVNRHTPGNSPDSQGPAVSDPGLVGSDYLSADIQSQGSSKMDCSSSWSLEDQRGYYSLGDEKTLNG